MKRYESGIALILLTVGTLACSADPETAKRQFVAEGDRYFAGMQYREAILQYRNALREDDRYGEARLKLTEAYLAAGDARNALAESVRAADLLPDNVDAQIRAGGLLLLARQFPEAQARATAALAKDPRNPRALILLGNSLAGVNDLDAAIAQMEQAIEADPQLTLSYSNLGALQLEKGNIEAAEAALRRAVEVAPRSASAHSALANFFWASGRRDEAERELVEALQIEPRSPAINRAMATLRTTQGRLADAEPYLKTYVEATGTVDSQLLLADHYLRTKKLPEAISLLTSIARQDNGFAQATMRLAAIDFANGRRPAAYDKLQQIVTRVPGNEIARQMNVRFLLAEGKDQEALRLANALVGANPRSVRGQYVRGLALEATGSPDAAIAAYQEVLRGAPASGAVQMKLAELHLARGNFKDALSLAQQTVKQQPRSAPAHLVYGQALLKNGDLVSAERELLTVAKATPSSVEAHNWLGMLYEAKRDWRSARRSFERARELDPASGIALAGLASIDIAEKRPAAAITRIEAQLATNPKDMNLLMMSALAYGATQDLPKAEGAYRRMLEIDPNHLEAYSGLGGIYLNQRRLDEARRTFEEIARKQQRPVAAETMIGVILVGQNRSAEARKHFERALQLDPRAAVAANNLAWDYANNNGNLDQALQLAQTAKAALPQNATVTDTLGWVYYKKGLTAVAVSMLREAAQQNPSSAGIHHRLGLAYLQDGNKVQARSTLEQALKLKPNTQTADEIRRTLATIQG